MEKKAGKFIEENLSLIFSFVCKRVSNQEDQQDVTQEICLNLYESLCLKEIREPEHYMWVVAKHCLANYYRRKSREIGMTEPQMQNDRADMQDGILERLVKDENVQRLRKEIAYLSKMQRNVLVQYYFEGRRQSEIAENLHLPLGTVKWHLNAAKQELRKGMEIMREQKTLNFAPVYFSHIGMSGSTGEQGAASNMFRSTLSQNIVYASYHEAHTVNELADILAVSPVYVESELEYLEEMQLVCRQGKKYLANILIEEPKEEQLLKKQELYEKISERIATKTWEYLEKMKLWERPEIGGNKDKNMVMWAIIPYLMAWQERTTPEKEEQKKGLTFEEVAALRPDGGRNLIQATIKTPFADRYLEERGMTSFVGPCWNERQFEKGDSICLWLVDGKWSAKRVTEHYGGPNIWQDLALLYRFCKGEKLPSEDYAFLCQKNYIRKEGQSFVCNLPILYEGELRDELLATVNGIKEEVLQQFEGEIAAYKQEILQQVPKQVRPQQQFYLQQMFGCDPWLVLYTLNDLQNSGKLSTPDKWQRQAVSQLLVVKMEK